MNKFTTEHMSKNIYGLVFLGALVYYIQHADTFWVGVLGVIKAMVWPAMLAYKVWTLLAL